MTAIWASLVGRESGVWEGPRASWASWQRCSVSGALDQDELQCGWRVELRVVHSCTNHASSTKCDQARPTQSFPQRSTFSSLFLFFFFPLLPQLPGSLALTLSFHWLPRLLSAPSTTVGSLDYCRLVLYNIDITAAPQAVLPLMCPPDSFTRIRARSSWTSKLDIRISLLVTITGKPSHTDLHGPTTGTVRRHHVTTSQ